MQLTVKWFIFKSRSSFSVGFMMIVSKGQLFAYARPRAMEVEYLLLFSWWQIGHGRRSWNIMSDTSTHDVRELFRKRWYLYRHATVCSVDLGNKWPITQFEHVCILDFRNRTDFLLCAGIDSLEQRQRMSVFVQLHAAFNAHNWRDFSNNMCKCVKKLQVS